MTTQDKTFTTDQRAIIAELCLTHGLDASQISFDGDALNPIFDYEANSALSVKLTDIKVLDCELKERTPMQDPATSYAVCTVVLPEGVTRTVEDSATIGEVAGGRTLETRRDAEGLAQNRASRRGIRSVGVNLYNAHKAFMQTGEPTAGTIEHDPRAATVKEIHALADELGYSKSEYQDLLRSGYDGRSSTTELNDFELQNFARLLRSLRRVQQSRQEYKAAA